MSKTHELIGNPQTGNSSLGVVRRSFTIEDLKKAFNDGCELINQEWHEAEFCIGERCGCKGVKLDYENFDEWVYKNYA